MNRSLHPPKIASTPLLVSLNIQRRVIGALVMREILDRWGRHNIGFLWLFFEPMIFTLAVAALWSFSKMGHGSTIPIVAFALTGYSAVLLWRNMPNRCVRAVQPNHTLMHHRNIKLMDIYGARLLLEASGATISFMLLSLLFIGMGWMKLPEDTLKVVFGWLLLAWFGCSLAILIGSLSERFEIVHILWHPISYILFPLSGAAFAVSALPEKAQQAVLLLPMVHGVELIREGYFGSQYHAHYDIAYMAGVTLVMTLFGMAQLRYVSRHIVA